MCGELLESLLAQHGLLLQTHEVRSEVGGIEGGVREAGEEGLIDGNGVVVFPEKPLDLTTKLQRLHVVGSGSAGAGGLGSGSRDKAGDACAEEFHCG